MLKLSHYKLTIINPSHIYQQLISHLLHTLSRGRAELCPIEVELQLRPLQLLLLDRLVRVLDPVPLGEVRPVVVRGPVDGRLEDVVLVLVALGEAVAGAVHLLREEGLGGGLLDAGGVS